METFWNIPSSFFDWLLYRTAQGSVLAGVILLVQWLFRKQLSAGWRHGLWLLLLARLAMPTFPESALSLFNLAHACLPPADTVANAQNAKASIFPAIQPGQAGPRQLANLAAAPVAGATDGRTEANALDVPGAPPGLGVPKDAQLEFVPGVDAPVSPPLKTPPPQRRTSLLEVLGSMFRWCWLLGVVFLTARFAWQNASFVARLRTASPVRKPAVLRLLESCAMQMGVRRVPLLIETRDVRSPALYGCIRPRILLPQGIAEAFSLEELRFVFLHELGHVKRQDMAVNWIMATFQALHWFNPVLWLAFARMRADREIACDALALSRAADGESQPYGQTIIRILADLNQPKSMAGLLGILEDKRQIKDRIRMIARFKKTSPWQGWAVCICVFLAMLTLTDAQTDRATPPVARPVKAAVAPASTAVKPTTQSATQSAAPLKESNLARDAKLLIELGKLDEAEAKAQQALRENPQDKYAAYYLNLVKEARYAQAARKREVQVVFPGGVDAVRTSPGRRLIVQLMSKIVLGEVRYDRVPLAEVVRDLVEQSRKNDPEKRGVNIVLNPPANPSAPSEIDPATGLPYPAPVDLNSVQIRLVLRDVRLGDVLDAVVKVAEEPIQYSIEDYAIVFSTRLPEVPRLFTRTYRVDPETFLAEVRKFSRVEKQTPLSDLDGLEPSSGAGATATDANSGIGNLVRNFFFAAGVDFSTSSMSIAAGLPQPKAKALFFNDRTGLLLVRATMEELDLVERAIQVLNTVPPQVTVEARVIEISQTQQRAVGFDWFLGRTLIKSPKAADDGSGSTAQPEAGTFPQASPATDEIPVLGDVPGMGPFLRSDRQGTSAPGPATLLGILTDPQFRVVLRALEQRGSTRILAHPRVTTLSGRQIQAEISDAGIKLDTVPTVLADGSSIKIEVDFSFNPAGADERESSEDNLPPRLRVSTSAVIRDGQTLVLGPFPNNGGKSSTDEKADADGVSRVFLFLTPTIIDPAGNRVHQQP